MGCGASKQQQERLKSYVNQELGQINDQLAKQIAELRDVKNKRKPIYIIKDQEVEELTNYKEELEKKFQFIEKEILKVNKQLQIQAKAEPKKKRRTTKPIDIDDIADEEEWKKNLMNDDEITIKPFDDAQLEIESDNIGKKDVNKSSQSDILMMDSQQNIKKQIANADKIEEINNLEQQLQFDSKKIIIQNDQNNCDEQSKTQQQQDLHKIKVNIQEALGEDLQAYNDEIKNKLFSQDLSNQPQQQTLKNSEIEICFNEQSLEQIAQSLEKNITTVPKKSKSSQPQPSNQVQNQQQQKAEKQLFFSKQQSSGNNQKRNSRQKYQL
ncbi:unnamed protein product (macronuclear) [Paramecium tetraurelia]|uniref:Uncharacterized protein n=1 Tax=Paramecium tetraurelia TaxID=5888 RepID=A0C816_PARTE|nr:uncharacterized protein GSPATT00036064001 [Paramecium tetraurelia]CAK66933.1 unnamed protein product [Paramecium tetraurelia]|eukprot:XP_001434330.1 hypothetical protein (macronuclear) [Paramecium tetraurelia strain d4-2]